jgi:group I intron endonuclease
MDKYYVYVLMDSSKKGNYIYGNYSFNYEPFYIGKGTGNRINDTIYDKSPFKRNKINKLKQNNIDIKREIIIDNLSDEEAKNYEKELINIIGRRNLNEGTLVNLTDGGDGRVNSKPSEETKKKISDTKKAMNITFKHSYETIEQMKKKQKGENNGFYGLTHSDVSKDKISLGNSGHNHWMFNKSHSDETKKKLKEARSKFSDKKLKEVCQVFNKQVLKYDLNMNFLAEYKSVKEASEKNNINESIISKCCRGEIYNPTRYFFKYKNNDDKFKNNKFLISSNFNYCKKKYTLVKRNKTSCICNDGKNNITFRYKDVSILKEKATNDSNFAELYIFLNNYGKFKKDIDNYVIYNNDIKIYYNKLYENSELFTDKKEIFNRYDDNVINIFEDTWEEKKEIVKSRLLNKIGLTPNKVYARKCIIKEVGYHLKKEFLLKNHIQGDVRSKFNYGLYYKGELISLMTFGSLRKNLGQESKEGSYELLRFCNKKYYNIVGGASKLFKHFLKSHSVNFVLSYSDRCWGKGNLYDMLGFTISDRKIIPNYYYIVDYKRKNRFNYRKDILVSQGYDKDSTEHLIMQKRNLFRIYDCGSNRYELFPQSC